VGSLVEEDEDERTHRGVVEKVKGEGDDGWKNMQDEKMRPMG
jgi:hypothetical protein